MPPTLQEIAHTCESSILYSCCSYIFTAIILLGKPVSIDRIDRLLIRTKIRAECISRSATMIILSYNTRVYFRRSSHGGLFAREGHSRD